MIQRNTLSQRNQTCKKVRGSKYEKNSKKIISITLKKKRSFNLKCNYFKWLNFLTANLSIY